MNGMRQLNRTMKRPQGRAPSARAFTLIELILVMAMLLTVIAIAAPTLSHFFHGRVLDSEARRFLSLTRYAQSRAVSEGVPMSLWIDTQEGTYGLQSEVNYVDTDPRAVGFEISKDLTIEIAATQNANGTSVAPQVQAGVTSIRFSPDGFLSDASPAAVVFRQGDQDLAVISQSRNRLNYEIQTNAPSDVRR